MARRPASSPFSHGRSEVWQRPSVVRVIKREQARLGVQLREIRDELELTQEEAAELIGLHPRTLSRIELGHANLSFAVLVAIARAYGRPLASLFQD